LSLTFSQSREILIGEVLAIHAREGLVDTEKLYVDPYRYRPIGRLAGSAYSRQGEVFLLNRVTYKELPKGGSINRKP
jgi:flavin reductase (DIM6/NTAB) family NADH-FMN oxidoreductase RutF